ncbi:MAG TPA: transcriptional repressor [Vicinamibacterales bacterium]|nr:transcriptional repressor [Vicinamibacterales bacterium]HPW20290.1 transcriptional repressor [Vicinamibacterales bacterium]
MSAPAGPAAADAFRPHAEGGRRASKRERILALFLTHEGRLSTDDLVGLIRREDPGVSRATVYRTLRWMVDAGVARRIDFPEGPSRFEHAYRHPRHFHLICKTCNRSFEFLSSEIEGVIDEVASARGFAARQSVLQIYGTCEACLAGRTPQAEPATGERVFARDALRIAIATQRSALEFYTRASRLARRARIRRVFQKLADEARDQLSLLEARYQRLLESDPDLESRPTFLFFKGAAHGLFAEGADEVAKGIDDRQALKIGTRCERLSHQFFKRYGGRFDDSDSKRLFLAFADGARRRLDVLLGEYIGMGKKKVGAGRKSA